MHTTTPTSLNADIMNFCASITSGAPIYVPVRPEELAQRQQCFPNVARKVETDGGLRITGWRIWEYPNLYIEAEFHAIWQSPEANLVDITPLNDGETTILFLADKTKPYKGRQRDNIRMALADGLPIKNIFAAKEKQFKILNRNDRANLVSGEPISLKGMELQEYERTKRRITMAEIMIDNDLEKTAKCPCNSGRSYLRCCGKIK